MDTLDKNPESCSKHENCKRPYPCYRCWCADHPSDPEPTILWNPTNCGRHEKKWFGPVAGDGYECGVRDTEAKYARLVEAARALLVFNEHYCDGLHCGVMCKLDAALREIEGEK